MGGTAMDSVIASLFCNGVYNSQSMGIGGGFLMTYYDAKVKLYRILEISGSAATL